MRRYEFSKLTMYLMGRNFKPDLSGDRQLDFSQNGLGHSTHCPEQEYSCLDWRIGGYLNFAALCNIPNRYYLYYRTYSIGIIYLVYPYYGYCSVLIKYTIEQLSQCKPSHLCSAPYMDSIWSHRTCSPI